MLRLTVRIPNHLADLLVDDASKNVRSMNGQIVWILAEHYRSLQTKKDAEPSR